MAHGRVATVGPRRPAGRQPPGREDPVPAQLHDRSDAHMGKLAGMGRDFEESAVCTILSQTGMSIISSNN